MQQQRYAEAIADYDKCLELNANLAEAYYNRGLAKVKSSKKDEGIADLGKAGELGLYGAYSMIKQHSK